MVKLLVWCMAFVILGPLAACLLALYLVYLLIVGLVALFALLLRTFGVAVGLGWLATAAGVRQYREAGGLDGIRERMRGAGPRPPGPALRPAPGPPGLSPAEIEQLRRQVGASPRPGDVEPGSSVFQDP